MKPTEQIASIASPPKSGFFAPLCRLADVVGTGSPKLRRARKLVLTCLASLSALAVLLALSATPALAERARIFIRSFGGAASSKPDPYPLAEEPRSIAVDGSSGAVYVADAGNHRVEKFNAEGEFVLMFGKAVNKTKVDGKVATEAEQNVCTALEVELSGVECQAGEAGSTPGAFPNKEVLYVAVDNSAGPSHGDIYVAPLVEVHSHEKAQKEKEERENAVTKFDASGAVITSWGKGGQLDGSSVTTPLPGPFSEIIGVAVDPTGNLWVAAKAGTKAGTFEFNQEAAFKTDWQTPNSANALGVSVDSEDNVYFVGASRVFRVNAAGGNVTPITEETLGGIAHPALSLAAALDPSTGALYALESVENFTSPHYQLQRYEPNCPPIRFDAGCIPAETFTNSHLTQFGQAVAVTPDESKTVYVAQRPGEVQAYSVVTAPDVSTGKPSGLSVVAATLNGTVDPSGVVLKEGLEGCRFEWGETAAYGHEASCDKTAGEIGSGSSPVAVHAAVAGLQAGKTYHFRLVAANANDVSEPGRGQDVAFGPPLLESESAADVAATSATVQADVVPQNVDTRFRVEYGTSANYGHSTPEADVGAAGAAQSVGSELQGLAPATVYHYRFVAENVLGEGAGAVLGGDHTFTTQGAGGFVLPDGRQWEMVSPANRHGSSPEPPGSELMLGFGVTQAAADGSGLAYLADAPIETAPAGYGEFDQIFAGRKTGGWTSHDLAIPHGGTTNLSEFAREYRFFSEDMSSAVVQQFGPFLPLSPWASEQAPYLNNPRSGGFAPLVTGCPKAGESCPAAIEEHANVPPGTVFGQTAGNELASKFNHCPPQPSCGPVFVGATPDGAHVVLQSEGGLLEGHGRGLYEWSGGALSFVAEGTLGTPTHANEGVGPARHAISSDGSHVVFSKLAGQGTHLYMLDTTTAKTLQLDAVEPGCPAQDECGKGSVVPEFQAASSDGSRVFFTDSQKLTAQAGSNAGKDLYECEIVEDACRLTALTQSGGVPDVILGASEDGSWVYFAAQGVLGDGAEHGAVPGDCSFEDPSSTCNLYVRHQGETKLVAVLSTQDYRDWAGQGGGVHDQTARVSPSGRWLAFLSQRPLTGYDNRDAVTGRPDEEVYLYDAVTGGLSCASCDPTGARPHGIDSEHLELARHTWLTGLGIAAYLPLWTAFEEDNGVYQPRYLSDSGRLFFNSLDGLVPRDVNEHGDVYEYEPQGVGPSGAPCGPGSASGSGVFKPARTFQANGQGGEEAAGCVSLVSSGTSAQESVFMDASETGGDVFFLTTSHLVPANVEGGRSVYDAHECTSASPCFPPEQTTPPPCATADGCRQAATPQPQIFGAPASATFSGSGNVTPSSSPPAPAKPTIAQLRSKALAKALKACHKFRKRARRAVCEKQARKRYGPARKATRSHTAGKGRVR